MFLHRNELTITGSLEDVNTDLGTLMDSTSGSDTIFLNASNSNGVNALQQTIAVAVGSSGGGGPSPPVAPEVPLGANVPTGYASGMFVAYDSDGDSVTITGGTIAGTFGTASVEDDGEGNGFVSYTTGATADEAAAVAALGANSAVDSFTYTVTDDGTSQTAQGHVDVTLSGTDDGATADFWAGGGESANWNEGDNWSTGTAPDQNSDALLNLPVGVIVTDSEVSEDPNHLLEYGAGLLDIGRGAALVAGADSYVTNVTLEDGASFEVTQGNLYVAGSLTMNAGSSVLVDGGTLTVGPSGVIDVETDSPGSGVTLDGLTLINNGNIDVGATTTGAILTLDGGTSIAGGTLTIGASGGTGTVDVEGASGATLDGVTVTGGGIVEVGETSTATLTVEDTSSITGGTLTLGSNGTLDLAASAVLTINAILAGSGSINIGSGADLIVEGSPATLSGTIAFQASGDTLTIYDSALNASDQFVPVISGATSSDYIDFQGSVASVTPDYNGTNTVLTLDNGSDQAIGTLTLAGDDASNTFTLTTITIDGTTFTQIVDPPPATSGDGALTVDGASENPSVQITSGAPVIDLVNAPLSIGSGDAIYVGNVAFNDTVSFTAGTGALVLKDPETFTGQIVGFTGTAPDAAHSDTIDLIGINYDSSHFAETYNSSSGLLTVTDGSNTAHITFDNFHATLDFASDGNGGTLITDPPAAGSAGHSSASAPVKWGMNFGDDKINFDPVEPGNQPAGAAASDPEKAVPTVGDSGHDNFVFHANLGAEAEANVNAHADANGFASHPNTELAQQLTALTSLGPHAAAVFDLFHDDGVAPSGITPAQIHQLIQAGHLLH